MELYQSRATKNTHEAKTGPRGDGVMDARQGGRGLITIRTIFFRGINNGDKYFFIMSANRSNILGCPHNQTKCNLKTEKQNTPTLGGHCTASGKTMQY